MSEPRLPETFSFRIPQNEQQFLAVITQWLRDHGLTRARVRQLAERDPEVRAVWSWLQPLQAAGETGWVNLTLRAVTAQSVMMDIRLQQYNDVETGEITITVVVTPNPTAGRYRPRRRPPATPPTGDDVPPPPDESAPDEASPPQLPPPPAAPPVVPPIGLATGGRAAWDLFDPDDASQEEQELWIALVHSLNNNPIEASRVLDWIADLPLSQSIYWTSAIEWAAREIRNRFWLNWDQQRHPQLSVAPAGARAADEAEHEAAWILNNPAAHRLGYGRPGSRLRPPDAAPSGLSMMRQSSLATVGFLGSHAVMSTTNAIGMTEISSETYRLEELASRIRASGRSDHLGLSDAENWAIAWARVGYIAEQAVPVLRDRYVGQGPSPPLSPRTDIANHSMGIANLFVNLVDEHGLPTGNIVPLRTGRTGLAPPPRWVEIANKTAGLASSNQSARFAREMRQYAFMDTYLPRIRPTSREASPELVAFDRFRHFEQNVGGRFRSPAELGAYLHLTTEHNGALHGHYFVMGDSGFQMLGNRLAQHRELLQSGRMQSITYHSYDWGPLRWRTHLEGSQQLQERIIEVTRVRHQIRRSGIGIVDYHEGAPQEAEAFFE